MFPLFLLWIGKVVWLSKDRFLGVVMEIGKEGGDSEDVKKKRNACIWAHSDLFFRSRRELPSTRGRRMIWQTHGRVDHVPGTDRGLYINTWFLTTAL